MHSLDPWRTAWLLVQQHGSDAELHAAMRIDDLDAKGDQAGVQVWRRVIDAIDELQRTCPNLDEPSH